MANRKFVALGLMLGMLLIGGGVMLHSLAWAVDPSPATTQASAQPAPRQPPATRPVPAIQHVLVFSIDGLRPDMLLRCNTPNMHHLMDTGSFTFWARTTAFAITLPSHTSMMTGVKPTRHGIEWNRDLPLKEPIYPNFPTVFEIAKLHGLSTAMAAGKVKFNIFDRPAHGDVPAALDWKYIPSTATCEDPQVAKQAVQIILDHRPQMMLVHFPSVDNAGHAHGWGSAEQEKAVEQADACVGQMLDALQKAGVLNSTLIILSSDHGGAGFTHGPDDFRARYIPWIANGPGVRKHFDLTTLSNVTVNTEDTFATACYVLGLPVADQATGLKRDRGIDGEARKEIFEGEELLH